MRPLRGSRFALRQPDACRRGRMTRDHEPWPGGESHAARFEPSPCRRASGFAWPVVKSLLQPCEFRRPPRHESRLCGTRTRLLRRLYEHGIDGYGLRSWIFVSGEARFVSLGLPRTAGWNGAAAFDEGRWRRNVKWKPRIACNSTFKSKRRRAVPAAKPLGKPPRFVVARSANPICRHIWNSICGIAAMLTNRVFAHKSPGTPI